MVHDEWLCMEGGKMMITLIAKFGAHFAPHSVAPDNTKESN